MGEQFILRPTPFGKPTTVIVEKHGLTTLHGGKSRRIEFKDVASVYSWIMGFGGVLSFVGKDGRKVKLTGAWGLLTPRRDANMRAYHQASSAALRSYAAARPGAEVYVGPSPGDNRRTMAFTAVAVIVVTAINALQDGRMELLDYIAIVAMLGAVAYVGLTRFNIFRQPPVKPASVEAAEHAEAASMIQPR